MVNTELMGRCQCLNDGEVWIIGGMNLDTRFAGGGNDAVGCGGEGVDVNSMSLSSSMRCGEGG